MAKAIQPGFDLIPGKLYRITSLDPGDAKPSMRVGDLVRCAVEQPRCVDPTNRGADGLGVEWLADYLGDDGFGTLITGLEEV